MTPRKPKPRPSAKTLRRYHYEWEHFVRWAQANGHTYLPASPQSVAIYLSLFPSYTSTSMVLAAISYVHTCASLKPPNRSFEVRQARKNLALKQGLARVPHNFKPKKPHPRKPHIPSSIGIPHHDPDDPFQSDPFGNHFQTS